MTDGTDEPTKPHDRPTAGSGGSLPNDPTPTPSTEASTPPTPVTGSGAPTWTATDEAPLGWGVPPVRSAPRRPDRPRRWRGLLAAAFVGALVGSGSAAGVYLASDDGDTRAPSPVVVRPANELENPGDISEILARIQPATVSIRAVGNLGCGPSSGEIREGAGSGFVISPDGYVVTNSHVVGGAEEITVGFATGESYDAEIVGRDALADLAVLKIDGNGLPTVELGDSEQVVVGDAVVAIGNALGLEGGPSVTSGIVSAVGRTVPTECGNNLESAIQTDAAINAGNSGGPLVDAQGRVIGINTAIADPSVSQNVGFAIPISQAEPIIDDLRAGVLPAYLGVSVRTVDDAVRTELGLDVSSGAVIVNVVADSPAAAADLRVGDVLLRIGDREIATSQDVVDTVAAYEAGDEVEVVASRAGEEITARATLAERPDAT